MFGLVNSCITLVTKNIQIIINAAPQILAITVILSRLFMHSETSLNRILNSNGFFKPLPIKKTSILNWCLLLNLLKDGVWFILGIIITLIVAYVADYNWFHYFGKTTPIILLWVIIGTLISFTSMIIRIVITSHIQYENKIVHKLLSYGEIILSFILLIILLVIRLVFIRFAENVIFENYWLFNVLFSSAAILVLHFVIGKLYLKYEKEIIKYFEIENIYYSVKELPTVINKIINKCSSRLTQNILRLSLASRSYGFTKYISLVVILIQALILILFSISISEISISIIVFIITSTISIVLSFGIIISSTPFLFNITRPLPLSFKDMIRSIFKGGCLISIPIIVMVITLSLLLGLSGSIIASIITSIFVISIVSLRMFITFRYPYSQTLSDLVFILNAFLIALLFPLVIIVFYHYKKANQLWHDNGLL